MHFKHIQIYEKWFQRGTYLQRYSKQSLNSMLSLSGRPALQFFFLTLKNFYLKIIWGWNKSCEINSENSHDYFNQLLNILHNLSRILKIEKLSLVQYS